MTGGTVSASKYTSLKKLYAIRDNSYRGYHNKSGQVKDYDKHELDQLIMEKEAKQDAKAAKQFEKDQDALQAHLDQVTDDFISEIESHEEADLETMESFDEAQEPKKRTVKKKPVKKKPTKKKAAPKRKAIKKVKKPQSFGERLDAIESKIDELDLLQAGSPEHSRLRYFLKGQLQYLIDGLWSRLEIWGEFENTNRDIELLRQTMERFTNTEISRYKAPEDSDTIKLYLSRTHAESSDISCPIDWARSMSLGNSHHCNQWQPTADGENTFETVHPEAKMRARFIFTEFMGDKMLHLDTDITKEDYSELFV